MGKNKTISSHTSTYQIQVRVVCQFNPTLPLQQQLALRLPGACACRPDLISKDQARWRWPCLLPVLFTTLSGKLEAVLSSVVLLERSVLTLVLSYSIKLYLEPGDVYCSRSVPSLLEDRGAHVMSCMAVVVGP